MNRTWCVVGAGGHARAITDLLQRAGARVGCVADPQDQWPSPGVDVVADEESAFAWAAQRGAPVVVAVGANPARLRIVRAATDRGLEVPALVAATATVSADATLGLGVVVMEHAHVGPSARVGTAALVNTAAVVEHDCLVGEATHVAPGAVLLGHAQVGADCLVGAGSTVLVGRIVGDHAVVGAGAVVTRDLAGGARYVGRPARPLPADERP